MRNLSLALLVALSLVTQSQADDSSDLRLVPFPKEVRLTDGVFRLDRPLSLELPAAISDQMMVILGSELQRAGQSRPKLRVVETNAKRVRLIAADNVDVPSIELPTPRENATEEDYALVRASAHFHP